MLLPYGIFVVHSSVAHLHCYHFIVAIAQYRCNKPTLCVIPNNYMLNCFENHIRLGIFISPYYNYVK